MGARKEERTLEDLKVILERVAYKYLGRSLPDVSIEWGRYRRPRSRRKNIFLGLYFWADHTIRIHSVLRQRWVPTYFVEYVVYHEVLHHVMSPEMRRHALRAAKGLCKARDPHPEVFMLAEKLYKKYGEAIEWERKNLARLLAA